ncbi:hypothetical protein CFAM422_010204 [Trichoderma lentiforme]|uniref:Uncharacterized protein n=1 Tax=Trichoderma lentiforme TaxID=1567552 RepID=A0A9P4X8H1_9HYPO|nr:hypothetical protein CFAM422_010204 [Trichoderma lentiforme]
MTAVSISFTARLWITTAESSTTYTGSWTTNTESSTTDAESSTTDAEPSTTGADKPRCTHYIPCHCPSLPEYACLPLGDESSPLWLQKTHEDEDHNKVIIERLKKQCWRRIPAALFDAWFVLKTGGPLKPLKVRSFRWLISSDFTPRGYDNRQAPWRMLVRSYLMDLPRQLAEGNSQQPTSIFSWLNHQRHVGYINYRTKDNNAPPEINCGGRMVFSQYSKDFNKTLFGDWLVIVYVWAIDPTWLRKTDIMDLVSLDSVTGIRAWEFVDAVDAPIKIPHLFYQCQIRDSPEEDAVYAGHPYQQYNSVQIKHGDPVPARLAGLRRLMNGQARDLYRAAYE